MPRVIYVCDDRPKILHEAEGSDEDDTTWGTMGGAASSTRVVSLELAKIGEKTGKGDVSDISGDTRYISLSGQSIDQYFISRL